MSLPLSLPFEHVQRIQALWCHEGLKGTAPVVQWTPTGYLLWAVPIQTTVESYVDDHGATQFKTVYWMPPLPQPIFPCEKIETDGP